MPEDERWPEDIYFVYEDPTREMVMCMGCGDVTQVNQLEFLNATFEGNPPICSGCGMPYQPVPRVDSSKKKL